MSVQQSACIYFALQGGAVILWWLVLLLFPTSRTYFQIDNNSETTLLAFWLPDLLLIAVGSIACSVLCFLKSKYDSIALWFVVGAISYATLYCLACALMTDRNWLGVTLMLPAMLWSGVFAIALSPTKDRIFRVAKPASTNWIVVKTFVQIIVVWTIILFIFPYFIVRLEDKLGISRLIFPFQKTLAATFFTLISILGLLSAWAMSKIGRGTPLPLDTATTLVIRSSYAFVRNPMAISGLGQGLTVALWYGSPLILIYALMGGLIWQIVFRPLEETDLLKRFGADYQRYCKNVRCWIPRLKPYQIDATAVSSNSIELPSGKI